MQWIKAKERLPGIGSEVVVRANGSKYISRIYDEAPVDQVPKISFFFNARHHYEREHNSIEWLDESTTPLVQEDVGKAAKNWAKDNIPEEMEDTAEMEYCIDAFLAGAAHIGQHGDETLDNPLGELCKVCEDGAYRNGKCFNCGHVDISAQPLPSNIVEQLEKANPYHEAWTAGTPDKIWSECVSKLRELLSQQPVQGNESFEKIAKEIAYSAWKSAANAYRMYPNNKHTFTDYWENYGGKNSLSSYPASQGNAEVLVKALQKIEKMHGYEFVTEALASYNTGKGQNQ